MGYILDREAGANAIAVAGVVVGAVAVRADTPKVSSAANNRGAKPQ